MNEQARSKIEFGDFQTPLELARQCCQLLRARNFTPAAILEPTCGQGNFLVAALECFTDATRAVGVEINPTYAIEARQQMRRFNARCQTEIIEQDFFTADWPDLLEQLPDPCLVIGNPPWVTNAQLGALASTNLPRKANLQSWPGLAALTGKSNFDISEWILLRALEWLDGRRAVLAVLCKTAVARKVLTRAWKQSRQIARADLYRIDALTHFKAAVDAGWLVIEMSPGEQSAECHTHDDLSERTAAPSFGLRDGRLIADLAAYEQGRPLLAQNFFAWRSGIKHDCAKVLELERVAQGFCNGLGERVELEPQYVYPLLKSSEVAGGTAAPRRWLLVTQRSVGEETKTIRHLAPRTWQYLMDHAAQLDQRASSIYQGRPRFSIFGVGPYSFTEWKVGVSGFYKKLSFRVIGPFQDKPVVLDDTCYFLACGNQREAETTAALLNSDTARRFFAAFVFWDAKRPITVELLQQLDLFALGKQAGVSPDLLLALQRLRGGSGLLEQPPLFN